MLIESTDSRLLGATLLSFEADEALGELPRYKLELQTLNPLFDHADFIGSPLALSLQLEDGRRRPFGGYVSAGASLGQRAQSYVHVLELSSWMSFLQWRRNSRIFQDMSVVDIVNAVFADHPAASFDFRLTREYSPRLYTVQFEESDWHFVSRLLEEEGIVHFPEHGDEQSAVVFSDAESGDTLDGGEAPTPLLFAPDADEARSIEWRTGVQRLQRELAYRHTEVVLRDYDYWHPRRSLEVQTGVDETAYGKVEHYDYSACYSELERGAELARVRQLIARAQGATLRGEANYRALAAGQHVALSAHPDPGRNRGYSVTRIRLSASQDEPDSQSGEGDEVRIAFECLPDDIAFKTPQRHRKPRALGAHTATVVGPPGEEIHTDELARIRVHFHWDRYTRNEADASCWMRVVQMWNGKGWGVIAMPRIGNEVMINYVDGDIDRPVVVGQVYNGDLPTPYRLPQDIRYSGLVSRSLRFGEPRNASQVTFDDTRDGERILIHGERDLQNTVERNRVEYIENDSYEIIEKTKTREISNEIATVRDRETTTGVMASFTKLDNNYERESTRLTRERASLGGAVIGYTGAATSFTSVANSMSGVIHSIIGKSHQLNGVVTVVTGDDYKTTGVAFSLTRESNAITGEQQSTTGVSEAEIGSSTATTGKRTSVTGAKKADTGISISHTGISNSKTGFSFSRTGMSIGKTGVSMSMTGLSASVTGVSISATGLSISFTGFTKSKVGHQVKG